MKTEKSPMQEACEIVGSQAEMARLLDISPGQVNQMAQGSRPVPVKYCKAIERLTNGRVTVQQLCADWREIWPELVKTKRAKPWDGITERRTQVRRAADRAIKSA